MAGNSTVLDIKDVSVCFDGFYALTEVNAAVKRHSIHFFIGPNGAGKTTLLDISSAARPSRPQAALSSIRRAARMCA